MKKLRRGIQCELIPGVYYDESSEPKAAVRGVTYENSESKAVVRGVSYENSEPKEVVRGVTYENSEPKELVRGVTYENSEPKEVVRGVFYEDSDLTTGKAAKMEEKPGLSRVIVENQRINHVAMPNTLIVSETESTLLNFNLNLRKRIVQVIDAEDGEKKEFSYVVEIVVDKINGGKVSFTGIVDADKIKRKLWLMKITSCMASMPKDKKEQEEFQRKVQVCIENEDVPVEIIYPNAGWRRLPCGVWKYVTEEGVIGENSSLIHAATVGKYSLNTNAGQLGMPDTFKNAMAMAYICRHRATSLELLVYVHMSVLATLFEESGHPVNFVFGITGATNSRKTSLALAMAKLFNRDQMIADAEFATATECGIEKVLGTYKDGVVIIDDFKPGVNKAQQRFMDQKLDQLVRFYGNRVPKKRMTDFAVGDGKKFFPISGACLITMEVVTGVLSSVSRMFLTELTVDEVDNAKLAFYQENKWILPTHIYDFLSWVTDHVDEIIEYIHSSYIRYRGEHNFAFGRYAEMYAAFVVTANLILQYAFERRFWSEAEGKSFGEEVKGVVFMELKKMGNKARKRDKAEVVVKALQDGLFTSKICPLPLNGETSSRKADCYESENILYIRTAFLRRIVNEYSRGNFEGVEITSDEELIDILERLDILSVLVHGAERERSRKLPIQKGNTWRYLHLKASVLQTLFE